MTIALRVLLLLVCVLIGLVFPLMFIVAAMIGWSIFIDVSGSPDAAASRPQGETPSMTVERMQAAREKVPQGAAAPRGRSGREATPQPEPTGTRDVLAVAAQAADKLSKKTREFHDQACIDLALHPFFSRPEILLSRASELAVLRAEIDRQCGKESGPDAKRHFPESLRELVKALGNEDDDTADRDEAMSKARAALHRASARSYCEQAIKLAVDRHLEKLLKAHTAVTPDVPFPGADLRQSLVGQLRNIFLDGGDPATFDHPYEPPVGGLLFKLWWNENKARLDPGPTSVVSILNARN